MSRIGDLVKNANAKLFAILILVCCTAKIKASSGFSQLVFNFSNPRTIQVSENQSEPSIEILFEKTSVDELSKINFYDESLVHRAILSELGPAGTKLKLILKNQDVKANISQFAEPPRVVLDLFDARYQLERDPRTSLPLVNLPEEDAASSKTEMAAESSQSQLKMSETESLGRDFNAKAQTKNRNGNSKTSDSSSVKTTPSVPTLALVGASNSAAKRVNLDLDRIKEGRGPNWEKFPVYVYPLQTAIYHGRQQTNEFKKEITNGESLAEYGLKLFGLGHETRALEAYKNVLHKEPNVFDGDPMHLWAVAEIYLGAGELTLARSYQQALRDKHPESPLASLSAIRDLDIEALKFAANGKLTELPSLVPKLETIMDRGNNEIKTQIAVRKLFWNEKKIDAKKASELPNLSPTVQTELTGWSQSLENPRTLFLTLSMIANQIKNAPWDKNHSEFIGNYLEKYKDQKSTTWVDELKKSFEEKITVQLQSNASSGDYLGLIETYEKLPKNLRPLAETPATAWAVGEAYRNLSKPKEALVFYRKAAGEKSPANAIKANFWINTLNAELLADMHANQISEDQIREELKTSERALTKLWGSLTDQEKNNFSTAYKNHLEAAIDKKLKTPAIAKINLETWEKALNTKIDVSGNNNDDWSKNWRPTVTTVTFLKKLSDQFGNLGMPAEKQRAAELIARVKPDLLKEDPNAKSLWLNEIMDLAEEHRKANRYLEAGRLFAEAANQSEQWDKKAEALYKGGLLLYRAGQRDEAIKALQQASEDTNNIFYANLAKERLNQLEK